MKYKNEADGRERAKTTHITPGGGGGVLWAQQVAAELVFSLQRLGPRSDTLAQNSVRAILLWWSVDVPRIGTSPRNSKALLVIIIVTVNDHRNHDHAPHL